MVLATACGSPVGATGSTAPTAVATSPAACEPTSSRDAVGVLTANGVFGVIGDTSTFSAVAMNERLVIVHKGAKEQDTLALQFNSVGNSSPATSVRHGGCWRYG